MKDKSYSKAIAAAIVTQIFWGLSFLASSIGQESASPFVLMSYRFDIALLALTVPVLLGKQKLDLRGKSVKPLLLLGAMEPCIYFVGEQYGLKYSSSAFSGIMIAVIPIVTIIFAAIFLKERPSKKQWLFSALSIAGIIVITLAENSGGSITFKGFALLCLAVVTGSAFSVISCGVSGRFSVFERTYFMQAMGAVFFTTLALIENGGSAAALIAPAADPRFILAALFLALGASVAGYSLFNYAVSHAPMANVAVFHNLATIVSVAAGYSSSARSSPRSLSARWSLCSSAYGECRSIRRKTNLKNSKMHRRSTVPFLLNIQLSLSLFVGDALRLRSARTLGGQGKDYQRDYIRQHLVYRAGNLQAQQEVEAGIHARKGAEQAEQQRGKRYAVRLPLAEDHDRKSKEAEAGNCLLKLPLALRRQ